MDFWCEHVSSEACLAKLEGGCAWLGRGPGKLSERRSRQKAICPEGMRSFWKVAAFRLTGSIWIQSGRRALRCFQIELHHFVISILKWYNFMAQHPNHAQQSVTVNRNTITTSLYQDGGRNVDK